MTTRKWKTVVTGGLASLVIVPALAAAGSGGGLAEGPQDAQRSSSSSSSAETASTIDVLSFSWGTSHPVARGSSSGTCQPPAPLPPAAPNQNASRTNSNGRSATPAPPLVTPPPPENAACIAVMLSKKGYDYYCAKGVPKVIILMTDGMARYTLTDAKVETCSQDGMVLSFKTVDRTPPPAPAQQAPAPRATLSGSE